MTVLTRETPHRRKLSRPTAPVAPRRVSGPSRGRVPTTSPPRPRVAPPSRPARALAFVRRLPEHGILDRLLRNGKWIPLLGVLLAGIVAMQVSMLKLGSNIGRLVERSGSLQSQNEQLRASVASLGDDQRIERLAAGMGMVMATPQTIGFLDSKRNDAAGQAAANLKAPDPSSFLAALQAANQSAANNSADGSALSETGSTAAATGPRAAPTGSTTAATGSRAAPTGSTAAATGSTTVPTGSTTAPSASTASGATPGG